MFFLFLANGNLNENNHDSEQQRKFHYITMFFCLSPTKRSHIPLPKPQKFPLHSISTNKYLIQFHYAHHHHDHVLIAINCWATKTNQNISFDGKRFSYTIVFSLQRLCFAILRMMPVPKEVCTHNPIHNHLISLFLSTLYINIYISFFSSVKHNLWFCFLCAYCFIYIHTMYIRIPLFRSWLLTNSIYKYIFN